MKKFMRHFRHGQKGFTLIELLVVVAILGVLAAVAIPNVARFIDSGEEEAANTELANVQTAVTAYMADNGGTVPTYQQLIDATNPTYLLQTPVYGPYTIAADGTVSPP